MYGSARDNGLDDSSPESEDSNDENNWRNEYPDTDEEGGGGGGHDDDSVGEKDMRRAFNSMGMGKFYIVFMVKECEGIAKNCVLDLLTKSFLNIVRRIGN